MSELRVKAFHTRTPQLLGYADEINDWLREIGEIELVRVDQSVCVILGETDPRIIITIWYKIS